MCVAGGWGGRGVESLTSKLNGACNKSEVLDDYIAPVHFEEPIIVCLVFCSLLFAGINA